MLGVIFGVFFSSSLAQAGVIQKGDTLVISLRGVPVSEQAKVNGEYHVRDTGNIRVPIINVNVRALGRNPEVVERSIEEAFKKAEIYVAPTISVEVKNRVDERKVLSVGGHVKRPGRVQYREGMTLLEAVQQAGDRTTFGSAYVYLTRTVNGKATRYKYDIEKPAHQSLRVYPNDTIVVPQRPGNPFKR